MGLFEEDKENVIGFGELGKGFQNWGFLIPDLGERKGS